MKDLDLKQLISDADKILVGLGEEFDIVGCDPDKVATAAEDLDKNARLMYAPYLYEAYRSGADVNIVETLNKLCALLEGKDYYVLSSSFAPEISSVGWREGRFVSPCINPALLQCPSACEGGLRAMTSDDRVKIRDYSDSLLRDKDRKASLDKVPDLGRCPSCGKALVPNNYFCGKYDERGYLDNWNSYTKWLPFTLRHKLLILELGVGMNNPNIIRIPFERTVSLNQKASLIRVNSRFPFLPEGLGDRGMLIKENAFEWLNSI